MSREPREIDGCVACGSDVAVYSDRQLGRNPAGELGPLCPRCRRGARREERRRARTNRPELPAGPAVDHVAAELRAAGKSCAGCAHRPRCSDRDDAPCAFWAAP